MLISFVFQALEALRKHRGMGNRYLWSEEELFQGKLSTILGLLEAAHRCYDGHPPLPTVQVVEEIPYIGQRDSCAENSETVARPKSLLVVGGDWVDGSEVSAQALFNVTDKENEYIPNSNIDIIPSNSTNKSRKPDKEEAALVAGAVFNKNVVTTNDSDNPKDIVPCASLIYLTIIAPWSESKFCAFRSGS
jgi:hypothetical protein